MGDVLLTCYTRSNALNGTPPYKTRPIGLIEYQLKITLQGIKPPIWRQFTVPADIRLDQLHKIIQCVMGWKDSHLHQFEAHGFRFAIPSEDSPAVEDERKTSPNDLAPKVGDKLTDIYDLGDYWKHDLVVEAIGDGPAQVKCLSGARACPPEDCGGVGAYDELLEALADPGHERHDELKAWLGKPFDPEAFGVVQTNIRLAKL